MNFHLGCCPERWVYLFHLFYYSIIDCLPRYKREVAGRRLFFYAGIESTSTVPQVAHMQVLLLELSCLANMYYYYIITCILFYSDFMYLLFFILFRSVANANLRSTHTRSALKQSSYRQGKVGSVDLRNGCCGDAV